MKYFVKYMDDTLIKGGDGRDQVSDKCNLSDVYMLRWLRTKDSIVMCLSSGTVQVNTISIIQHLYYINNIGVVLF